MDCETLRDDRLDFLYGEADSATRQRVLEHLAGCEACREEVNGFRQLRQDLRSWTLPEGRGPSFVAPRRGSLVQHGPLWRRAVESLFAPNAA